MKKKYDIAALGELLVDFTEIGVSPSGMRVFERNPGGAPANVLCAAARQGAKTAFIGKVGDDINGRFLRDTLLREGVAVDGLALDGSVSTTLAFVALDDAGEREFSFARKPGADTCLRPEELDGEILGSCGVFHFGSLSLTDEPARSATAEAVRLAREGGAVISFDPNYRAPLWESPEAAAGLMRRFAPLADVVKVSEEEAELLTGESDAGRAIDHILSGGTRCVVVTQGARGAAYGFGDTRGFVPSFRLESVADTTGAGDAFWGAFLYRLGLCDGLEGFLADIEPKLEFAHGAAALCVGRRGAIPAMPTAEEISKFLCERGGVL